MGTSEVTDKFCVYTFCPYFDHVYGCHAPLGEGCDEAFTSRRWHEETMIDRVDEFCKNYDN